jgi:hypothetical protein
MINWFVSALTAVAVMVTPAMALPTRVNPDVAPETSHLAIKVASKAQKRAGYRACRAKYGYRLAYVTFTRSRYVCHFRKSNKALTKQAERNCRKEGLRLARVTSIKIKGNRSITRYVCKRK